MSNSSDTTASREEELAFLIIERILDVHIDLADAGGGDRMPDGSWNTIGGRAVVEVTSPPSKEVMRKFAQAERDGRQFIESSCSPLHLGALGEHLTDLVTRILARDVAKLRDVEAAERHLFLLGRTAPDQEYFARLSDTHNDGTREPVNDLQLPDALSDAWFQGRARRADDPLDGFTTWVARFSRNYGWSRHTVEIDERRLPSPSIVTDIAPSGWRSPSLRTAPED